jgi:hypothetical protein
MTNIVYLEFLAACYASLPAIMLIFKHKWYAFLCTDLFWFMLFFSINHFRRVIWTKKQVDRSLSTTKSVIELKKMHKSAAMAR